MRMIYISHWRFPSEKTMSPLIMKTCEMFAKQGMEVELWVPWRQNRDFKGLDPFEYHRIEQNFVIRKIPALDLTAVFPGSFFFFLMLATFYFSLSLNIFSRLFTKEASFYFHDVRDVLPFSFFKRPMFLEIHDFYKSGASWINLRIFPRVSGFIVTNRFKMEVLKKDFGIPETRMLHQPNAVDVVMFALDTSKEEARRRLNLPQDRKIILYTGHLFYWKGVDTLFDAHKFLAEDEIIYLAGGTDEDIQKLRVRIEKLKVRNVIVAGRRPHEEIPLWLKAADVLVLPSPAKYRESKYETSPVKLFEYMASGRPIVASDVPSIRNVADEKMTFFFEADNPRSLAATIHFVLSRQETASERAAAARAEVQKYSWKERTSHIVDFIRSATP